MVVNGTCHHDCPDSCGWQVTVTDGIAIKLRGNKDYPYSRGELCPKVNRFFIASTAPTVSSAAAPHRPEGIRRVPTDLVGHALSTIAGNLHRVIDAHGAEAVLPYSSAGNQSLLSLIGLDGRFFHHMGATRVVRALCGPTVGAGIAMTNGTARRSIRSS